MSESSDYEPGIWGGHDFGKARKAFDISAGRSYSAAKASKKSHRDLVPDEITTQSRTPLVILCDVTGSMGKWPATIFSKLPYLDHELKTEYLGEDMEICFGAIGDANGDDYPLQMRQFVKGIEMKKALEELVIEGRGGGQLSETYELGALYCARKISMPRAIMKPVLIMIGDEKPYSYISPDQAEEFAKVKLERQLPAEVVFKELQKKFSVYLIRKPYEENLRNSISSLDKEIYGAWKDLLGASRIKDLSDPQRVVDVIFGILAIETQKVDYFKKEIEERQKPDQVEAVYRSLEINKIVPPNPPMLPSGQSVIRKKSDGKDAKPLI
ncbi:MAG: hypothetical protein HYT20_00775 [Candidatus Nealsonbacteria bacterium]|nr:hypothetical protein [Candidatus Nealsonbacteria bacterium]